MQQPLTREIDHSPPYREREPVSQSIIGWRALAWACALFSIELFIALYVRDWLIRPYGGDFLAVILVYCTFRVVFRRVSSLRLGVIAFAIGGFVEVIQLLQVPARLGLARYPALSVAVGTSFEWRDLVAYALGVMLVVAIDERTRWIR
jgi:hypothetical protein